MKQELLQPTATIVAALIQNNPATGAGPLLVNEFLRVYQDLEEAQEKHRLLSQPSDIAKNLGAHGAR